MVSKKCLLLQKPMVHVRHQDVLVPRSSSGLNKKKNKQNHSTKYVFVVVWSSCWYALRVCGGPLVQQRHRRHFLLISRSLKSTLSSGYIQARTGKKKRKRKLKRSLGYYCLLCFSQAALETVTKKKAEVWWGSFRGEGGEQVQSTRVKTDNLLPFSPFLCSVFIFCPARSLADSRFTFPCTCCQLMLTNGHCCQPRGLKARFFEILEFYFCNFYWK